MPRNPIASKRYASALFGVTDKKKEAFLELKAFAEVLKRDTEVRKFFLSPVVSRDLKLQALAEVRAKFPASILFLEALIEADRIDGFDGIVEEFERLCDEETGELSVDIETATKLPDAAIDEIKVLLQDKWKKRLKVQTKVNPDLIGGFLAKAQGKLLDASVASQLESLKEQVFS